VCVECVLWVCGLGHGLFGFAFWVDGLLWCVVPRPSWKWNGHGIISVISNQIMPVLYRTRALADRCDNEWAGWRCFTPTISASGVMTSAKGVGRCVDRSSDDGDGSSILFRPRARYRIIVLYRTAV
jgi:hypothetical protein